MAQRICERPGCGKQGRARGLCSTHYWQVWKTEEHGPRKTAEERFLARIDRSGDCWIWTGTRVSTGYGVLVDNKKRILAHRFSYELAKGPIPDGFVVRHACDTPPCVNPAHLLTGTQADNVRDMAERGRSYWGQQTHCVNGHEFSGDNLLNRGDGRACRKCAQARIRAFKQKKRQERIDAGIVPGPKLKLTREQAQQLCDDYRSGNFSQKVLGAMYGIGSSTVSSIVRGEVAAYL